MKFNYISYIKRAKLFLYLIVAALGVMLVVKIINWMGAW